MTGVQTCALPILLVAASGCGHTLKHYDRILAEQPEWASRGSAFASQVRDIQEFLAGLGLSEAFAASLEPLRHADGAAASEPRPLASLAARPAPDPRARYQTRLLADRVLQQADWPELSAETATWVSPEDDCALRQLTLTARGEQPRTVTVWLAAEAALSPRAADEAHPAFANLFVQAAWDGVDQALYLRRRPRLQGEAPLLATAFLAASEGLPPGTAPRVQPLTDRARWLGRLGQWSAPAGPLGLDELPEPPPPAQPDPQPLPGQRLDTGLDPMMGLQVQVTLVPGVPVVLTFGLAASRELDGLCALVDKYRQVAHVRRSAHLSHTMAAIRLRELGFDADTWTALLRVKIGRAHV